MKTTKDKVILFFKIVVAVATAVLSVLGASSLSSCSSVSSITMRADSVHMYRPQFNYTDSIGVYDWKR